MTQPLGNITVGITEHRYTKEFSALFERLGAQVDACPLLEEKPVDNHEELQHFVRLTVSGNLDIMIFLTGVGAKFLISEAESIGLKDPFLGALEKITVVVRGPKPVAALRQFGVRVDVVPEIPTTEGVIEALRTRDLRGLRVGVQLYGTPNPQLVSALESKGAGVVPVQVYTYGAAAGRGSVQTFITRIINREIQVVTFTSAPQVRMLFDIASELRLSTDLERALKNGVIIASIGEVTNRALAMRGLVPHVVPKQPKMGPMAQAVGEFFAKLGEQGRS
ncbi:MAG: uroporphyrinogen III synthase HEM4 [Acidobacteria bacterium]|nr:MAG: uroporphyrinogen III synthase HEM4 [Acidobacteriota bacterium]